MFIMVLLNLDPFNNPLPFFLPPVCWNLHYLQLLEEEEVEVPISKETPKEAAKLETDEALNDAVPPSSNETDANMQDAKAADAPGAENSNFETGDKPVQMETDNKVIGFSRYFLMFNVYNKPSKYH